MTFAPKPSTVERPGTGRRAWHLNKALYFGVPAAVLAVMLYFDYQFDVWSMIPLRHHPATPLLDFLLVGTLAFPLGAISLIGGLDDVAHAVLSATWPTTKGRVLTSEVEHTFGKGPHFMPVVSFEFQAGGQRYESTTRHFGQHKLRFASSADDVIRSYPVGREVTVHYDPDEPATAALETSRSDAYRAVLSALGWLLIPFLMYFQFFRDILHG